MIQEVSQGIYLIKVPFPRNPLRDINIYAIRQDGRWLIIDTGIYLEECRQAILAGFAELGIALEKCDFFITHMHVDHIGNLDYFATANSRIYFNRKDAQYIDNVRQRLWQQRSEMSVRNGFPLDEFSEYSKHPVYKFSDKDDFNYSFVEDGDKLEFGDFVFTCIQTPGHSPGHTCLYEANKKILFSGDHILQDITPNISSWDENGDPLTEYMSSLDKISDLDVELVLPGHRRTLKTLKQRVDQLKQHHEERASEVLTILTKSGLTAYGVASRMHWNLTYRDWQKYPVIQRIFATGEAMAHLHYLETQGKVRRTETQREISFSLY